MPPKKTRSSTRNTARTAAQKPVISDALRDAVDGLDESRLRALVKHYCESMMNLREALERECLVLGKDIVRYHADTASEDDTASGTQTEEESDSENVSRRKKKKQKPITTEDDEFAPRFAKCKNCDEEFDVRYNEKGDCVWHSGMKEIDEDADIWADHDPRCHGNPYDFKDDPDMAEGFTWDCCDKMGNEEGCKSTKHKAAINLIVKKLPVMAPKRGQKRKAVEEIRISDKARCRRCFQKYEVDSNKRTACTYHPGYKEVWNEDGFWDDHDESIGGACMSLVDESEYEDGFVWSCCEKAIRSDGCKKGKHVNVRQR